MEKRIFRVLGKKGNTTIPYALRKAMDIKSNELISYEQIDEDSILVTREKVCKNDVHKCLAEHENKEPIEQCIQPDGKDGDIHRLTGITRHS